MITNLTEGKPTKVLFLFTLPMLLGNIFQQVYNLADSLIVGQVVGKEGLAAVGGSFGVIFLAIGLAIGASQGCSIVISQLFGAKDFTKMKSAFSTALISVISLGIITTVASFFFLKPLLTLLKVPEDIYTQSMDYLKIIFIGSIFMFAYNCLTYIFNALGDSKTPLKFLIASTIINIILDILFVAYFKMGVSGAAYATVISQIISAVGLFIYFMLKINRINFTTEHVKLFDFSLFKKMSIIAIPSMLQQSMVSIGMIALQGLVNSFGTNMMAGYTAATKIDSLAMMPMLNMGIAISSYTAQNLGANKPKRVKEGYHSSIKLIIGFGIIISLVSFIFGSSLIRLFLDGKTDVEVINYGAEYLQIVSVFYIVAGVMFITNGILRGAGAMKMFMTSTLVNIVSRILFAYLLVPVLGYSSIFWSIPIGWILAGIISFICYSSGKWINKTSPKVPASME